MTFQLTRFIHPDDYSSASCALTAHFHPYHTHNAWRLFSATLAVSNSKQVSSLTPSVRWCNALRCPDFPHLHSLSKVKPRQSSLQNFRFNFFLLDLFGDILMGCNLQIFCCTSLFFLAITKAIPKKNASSKIKFGGVSLHQLPPNKSNKKSPPQITKIKASFT